MAKNKSNLESAAGKLISTIQKEWGDKLGESQVEVSERVMDKAHELLQAAKAGDIVELLNGRSVTGFLGELWVRRHHSVKRAISELEAGLEASGNV